MNKNLIYVNVENTVYSLTKTQYKMIRKEIDDGHFDNDKWSDTLIHIQNIGKIVLELNESFNF